jgi:hypothetical protein
MIDQLKNMIMLVLGALILGAHVLIFKLNQYMFTVIMCIYIIGYTILVIVFMYKNNACYNTTDSNILLNMSIYTIFLEIFLIVLSIFFMIKNSNIKKY